MIAPMMFALVTARLISTWAVSATAAPRHVTRDAEEDLPNGAQCEHAAHPRRSKRDAV